MFWYQIDPLKKRETVRLQPSDEHPSTRAADGDHRSTDGGRRSSLGVSESESHYAYLLTYLTLLTLPYIPYLTYLTRRKNAPSWSGRGKRNRATEQSSNRADEQTSNRATERRSADGIRPPAIVARSLGVRIPLCLLTYLTLLTLPYLP